MALLELECLTDFFRCQVVRDQPGVVECPLLAIGQIEHFGCTHGQRDNNSIGQIAKRGK